MLLAERTSNVGWNLDWHRPSEVHAVPDNEGESSPSQGSYRYVCTRVILQVQVGRWCLTRTVCESHDCGNHSYDLRCCSVVAMHAPQLHIPHSSPQPHMRTHCCNNVYSGLLHCVQHNLKDLGWPAAANTLPLSAKHTPPDRDDYGPTSRSRAPSGSTTAAQSECALAKKHPGSSCRCAAT